MRNSLIAILFLVACIGSAQDGVATLPAATSQPDGACIRATDADAWNSIRLTSEQLKEVRTSQSAFVKAGDLLYATDSAATAVDESVVRLHRDQIRTVLSATQYDRWVQWCIERTMPIKLKE